MSAVLQHLASLATGLTKAELHILIELAARAAPSALEATVSSRELAQITGLARASVQRAIDSLNRKRLIQSDWADIKRATVHHVICLGTAEIQHHDLTIVPEAAQKSGHLERRTELELAQMSNRGGLTFGPVPAQTLSQAGQSNEAKVGQHLTQSGLEIGPGVAQKSCQEGLTVRRVQSEKSIGYENPQIERANARADSIEKYDFDKTIDRLGKAKKADYEEEFFEHARNWIASHQAKFAREENRLPGLPDDTITAQFLAVADWSKLSGMLYDLASERKEAGHSYGWYVTVALQRIYGFSPRTGT